MTTGDHSQPPATTARRTLPASLFGLAGLACVACCAVPLLIAAGVLGGATWATFGQLLPGIAIVLAVAAAGAWWWAARSRARHTDASATGRHACRGSCSCAGTRTESAISARD